MYSVKTVAKRECENGLYGVRMLASSKDWQIHIIVVSDGEADAILKLPFPVFSFGFQAKNFKVAAPVPNCPA